MIGNQFILPVHDELVVDLFAGGGGASTGIEQAIGRHVDIAINHAADAVALHQANHPQTLHFAIDVFEAMCRAAPAPQQATPEPAPHPLAARCYTMSEPHLSGYRLILGFETLEAVDAAHTWVENVRKAHQQATPDHFPDAGNMAQAAPEPVGEPRGWAPPTEAEIDEYLEDYEMRGNDEDGRDACHTPTEGERLLIKDAIMGLLADTRPAPAAQAVPMTDEQFEDWWLTLADYNISGRRMYREQAVKFLKAVEAHHGITAQAKEVQK